MTDGKDLNIYDVLVTQTVFSPEDCAKILSMYITKEYEDGLIRENNSDFSMRKSKIQFVPPSDANGWIFQKIVEVAAACNSVFQFELDGLREGFQFTKYGVGDHYRWHVDLGAGERALRKLSIVVQLTPDTDYEGGGLEFFPASFDIPRTQGTTVVFPSYMAHRVAPVTKGVRHSLVSWVSGEKTFA